MVRMLHTIVILIATIPLVAAINEPRIVLLERAADLKSAIVTIGQAAHISADTTFVVQSDVVSTFDSPQLTTTLVASDPSQETVQTSISSMYVQAESNRRISSPSISTDSGSHNLASTWSSRRRRRRSSASSRRRAELDNSSIQIYVRAQGCDDASNTCSVMVLSTPEFVTLTPLTKDQPSSSLFDLSSDQIKLAEMIGGGAVGVLLVCVILCWCRRARRQSPSDYALPPGNLAGTSELYLGEIEDIHDDSDDGGMCQSMQIVFILFFVLLLLLDFSLASTNHAYPHIFFPLSISTDEMVLLNSSNLSYSAEVVPVYDPTWFEEQWETMPVSYPFRGAIVGDDYIDTEAIESLVEKAGFVVLASGQPSNSQFKCYFYVEPNDEFLRQWSRPTSSHSRSSTGVSVASNSSEELTTILGETMIDKNAHEVELLLKSRSGIVQREFLEQAMSRFQQAFQLLLR
jgi:hypothetical protein